MTFYQGNDYDGISYGPWGNGTYKLESDFADNSINGFIATALTDIFTCTITLFSGCCPLQGDWVKFEIDAGTTRYVNRDVTYTSDDSGSTSIWSDGSLWVSGIMVSYDSMATGQTISTTILIIQFAFFFCYL